MKDVNLIVLNTVLYFDIKKDYEPLAGASPGVFWWWVNEFDYSKGSDGVVTRSFRIPGMWENYHCTTKIDNQIYHVAPGGRVDKGFIYVIPITVVPDSQSRECSSDS